MADFVADAQKDLLKTVDQSGGSMRDLIEPAKPAEIKPVAPNEAANVSNALPDVISARSNIDDARSVTSEQTVAGQLRELLESDSPYLEQARESGRRYSASRGMLNSALGAGHAEQARIAAALPVASQDAATFANAARQYQSHLETLIQQANAGDIEAQLTLQQAGYNSQLSAQEHTQRLVESAMNGDMEARLQLQRALGESVLSGQQFKQTGVLQEREQQHETTLQRNQFGHETNLQSRAFKQESAMQQSAFRHDMSMQDARLAHDRASQQSQQAFAATLAANQRNHEVTLQSRDFQQQQTILGQQQAHALGMTEREAEIWTTQQNQLHEQTLHQISFQANASRVEQRAELTARTQSQYLTDVSRLQNNLSIEVSNVYNTQGLTVTQQRNAVAEITDRYNRNLSSLRMQYEESPFWSP